MAGCISNLSDIMDRSPSEVELICVDNWSTDETHDLLICASQKDPRIRVLRSPEKGIVSALNEGLKNANGVWIMRHDADDVSHPDRVLKFAEFIRTLTPDELFNTALMTSWSLMADGRDNLLGIHQLPNSSKKIRDSAAEANPFIHGAVFLNRNLVISAGGYSPASNHVEDYELWKRLGSLNYNFRVMPDFLYWFRVHGGSVSSNRILEQAALSERFEEVSEKGIWTPSSRGLLKRLTWENRRADSLILAFRRMRAKQPTRDDLFALVRLIFGRGPDLVNSFRLTRIEAVKAFRAYVQKTSRL